MFGCGGSCNRWYVVTACLHQWFLTFGSVVWAACHLTLCNKNYLWLWNMNVVFCLHDIVELQWQCSSELLICKLWVLGWSPIVVACKWVKTKNINSYYYYTSWWHNKLYLFDNPFLKVFWLKDMEGYHVGEDKKLRALQVPVLDKP